MNTAVVGKSAQFVAGYAGFKIPPDRRILLMPLTDTGKLEPLSHEKLTTVLGWYEVDGWEQGCERSIELINTGGRGHTQIIYANDEKVIMAFGLEKPVFRILVNTMGTLGAIGMTTSVMPSLTLGAGGIGGSITGDNIGVYHLFNIKRMAFETSRPPDMALRSCTAVARNRRLLVRAEPAGHRAAQGGLRLAEPGEGRQHHRRRLGRPRGAGRADESSSTRPWRGGA